MVFLMRALPALLSSIFLLSSCGGGGGGGSGSGAGNNISSTASSQPPIVTQPIWKDAGALGNNILIMSGDNADAQQYIQKIDSNGNVITLTPPLVKGGKIAQFLLSPDSKKVAYLADQETDNIYELFLTNMDGSFNTKISHKLSSSDITSVSWSLDSQYLLYRESAGNSSKYYVRKFNGEAASEITYTDTSGATFNISAAEFKSSGNEYTYLASNSTNSHVVTVDLITGKKKTDQLITKNVSQSFSLSPSGKFFIYGTGSFSNSNYYIQNLETSDEQTLKSNSDFAFWWSPKEDKLATFDFNYLSIYDPALASSKTIFDFSNDGVNSISWINFWESNGENVVVSTAGNTRDVFVIPVNTGTAFQLKKTLGTTEAISEYQTSPNGKLLALTEGHNLYTLNLDGTDIKHFSATLLSANVRRMSWSSDLQQILFMQYDSEKVTYYIKKMDLSTEAITTIPVNKTVFCYVVDSNSDRSCKSFFDET